MAVEKYQIMVPNGGERFRDWQFHITTHTSRRRVLHWSRSLCSLCAPLMRAWLAYLYQVVYSLTIRMAPSMCSSRWQAPTFIFAQLIRGQMSAQIQLTFSLIASCQTMKPLSLLDSIPAAPLSPSCVNCFILNYV